MRAALSHRCPAQLINSSQQKSVVITARGAAGCPAGLGAHSFPAPARREHQPGGDCGWECEGMHREGFFDLSMLCSAPQPSEATWFAASPHLPLPIISDQNQRDQTSGPSLHTVHREGITIPLPPPGQGNPIPWPHPPSISTEGPAAFTLSQAELPYGSDAGSATGTGDFAPGWAWQRGRVPGQPPVPWCPPQGRQSGDTAATWSCWDFSCEAPGDFCHGHAYVFRICLSFFPYSFI